MISDACAQLTGAAPKRCVRVCVQSLSLPEDLGSSPAVKDLWQASVGMPWARPRICFLSEDITGSCSSPAHRYASKGRGQQTVIGRPILLLPINLRPGLQTAWRPACPPAPPAGARHRRRRKQQQAPLVQPKRRPAGGLGRPAAPASSRHPAASVCSSSRLARPAPPASGTDGLHANAPTQLPSLNVACREEKKVARSPARWQGGKVAEVLAQLDILQNYVNLVRACACCWHTRARWRLHQA